MRPCSLLLAIALLGHAGCRPSVNPKPAAPTTPPGVTAREVPLHKGFITVRIEMPDHAPRPMPAVITPLETRIPLLEAGAAVVTYQVHWAMLGGLGKPTRDTPPNTVGKWLLASPDPKVIGKSYFGLQAGTATETIPQVLDVLAQTPEIDPRRIGIGGSSTTGFTALMAVAHDKRLSAAAVVVSCGDFHDFLARSPLAMNGARLTLDPAYDTWLREREPYRHPEQFTHAAVLMVNGTADVTVPFSCAETTAKHFRPAYARAGVPDRFRFVAVDGGTHNLGEQAMREVLAWWQRWLIQPPTP